MRKLILSAYFLTASIFLFAQKLDEVEDRVKKGKYVEAKEKIDAVLADTKNQKSANAWYYKGKIYNELSKDSLKTDLDYRMEAFNAFKKYQELDPKNIMLTLEQNGSYFQLYEGYYNHGIKAFNQKKYDVAFSDFKNALMVKDYVYDKKYEVNGFKFAASKDYQDKPPCLWSNILPYLQNPFYDHSSPPGWDKYLYNHPLLI